MGAIELEIGHVIKEVVKDPKKSEALLRRLALIVERQALAIKTIVWYKDYIDKANEMDQALFIEIQQMRKDILPAVEPAESTVETTFAEKAP